VRAHILPPNSLTHPHPNHSVLMRLHGLPLEHACTLVKSRRPIVCPNAGFLQQLGEEALFDGSEELEDIEQLLLTPAVKCQALENGLRLDEVQLYTTLHYARLHTLRYATLLSITLKLDAGFGFDLLLRLQYGVWEEEG
jgi:hypothetical protein